MSYNVYKYKGSGKPNSFQIPLKSLMLDKFVDKNGERINLGPRRVKYVPGANSYFEEDIKGDLPRGSLWIIKGKLEIPTSDTLTNELIQRHWMYGKRFYLWTQENEDKEKLSELRFKAQARQLIDEADKDKIRAIALAIFGEGAKYWDNNKAELQLREYADFDPQGIQEKMNKDDYESRFLAGLAFTNNLIKENSLKTAVIWADSGGEILKLAKGENGIDELGRFLSKRTEQSELVVQAIGERLERLETNTNPKDVISEKDREIAELKAKLKQIEDSKTESDNEELLEARKNYKEKYKSSVPRNKKNDLDWILSKL